MKFFMHRLQWWRFGLTIDSEFMIVNVWHYAVSVVWKVRKYP
jgi:hypothetical protein